MNRIDCLDHGFVRLVDRMGDDSSIVEAARCSYQNGTTVSRADKELINYLYRHKHTTPFEMVEFKFHCKMPIFVARQWIRHRTANVNEYSARYSILEKEFYIPKPEQLMPQSKTNKQGRAGELTVEQKSEVVKMISELSGAAYDIYSVLLGEEISIPASKEDPLNPETYPGIARELARMVVPTNIYTQWYWKIDLHNLLHFLSLRMDSHAQYEIRVFADAIYELIKPYVPAAIEAFDEYHPYRNAVTFSGKELNLITFLLNNPVARLTVEPGNGFSKGEWNEFRSKIKDLASDRVAE